MDREFEKQNKTTTKIKQQKKNPYSLNMLLSCISGICFSLEDLFYF